ncbi:hypothetical protein HYW19_02395 [Candidatus Woesearchaeota archaeon]|nr:hypothetical protein [Candidatus Woesearchaeota archaeon]
MEIVKAKRGIELSLTFLVTIILAVIILAFGVRFLYSLTSEATELDKISTEQLDKKFAELSCSSNEKVCIGIIRKRVPKGKTDAFGFKIINIDATTEFKVEVNPSKAFDKQNNEIPNRIEFKYNDELVEIEKNEEKSLGIGFEVPKDAVSGTYVFDVGVKYRANDVFVQYNELQKIYIEVP